MFASQFSLWPCKGIFLSNSHFGTIFSHTQVLQHHLSSHRITPRIKWLFSIFPWRLRVRLRPWALFWFFQVGIPMHVTFISKWSFWDGFWTTSKLFSPWKFSELIPLVVPTLFSYCTGPHSTLNCTCPWNGPLFNHDQAFRWNSSHCSGGNIVSIHKPSFMFSISWSICNTLFPTPIWSYN